MTAVVTASSPSTTTASAASTVDARDRAIAWGKRAGTWLLAIVVFCIFVWTKGANPISALQDMFKSTLDTKSMGDVLVRSTPLILAGLAVAVPARAGLVNVGGEGQIVIGSVAACGVGLALDGNVGGGVVIVLMLLAAAVAGAVWAGLAALLRTLLRIPEAITTLLLNYVAIDIMLYLIYDRWKNSKGTGQPTSRPLSVPSRLSVIGDSRVHAGIFIAVGAAIVMWLALTRTSWGFKLRVVGGNPEAARRAGLPVKRLLMSAMVVGGALGGMAGMVHFAGAEFSLRQGMTAGFGYTAFLASWLGRHHPLKVVVGALLLGFLSVGGTSLQIDSQLPAATVNVLMALVLLAVLANSASAFRTSRS